MIPRILILSFLIFRVASAQDPAAPSRDRSALTTSEVAARSIPATLMVIAIGADGDTLALGSGFLIRDDGVVVTNFHVLRGASSAIVVLASKERFTRVRVIEADSALDLAILKIPGAGLPTLSARTTVPPTGERVIAIGSPLGLANTVSDGIVSATRVIEGRELVQITAPISPGSSGGAVLDSRGNVFAVSTLYLKGGQSLNFAVPVRYALGMLKDSDRIQSVAQIFAHLLPDEEGNSETTRAGASNRRSRSPRESLTGTYEIGQIWYDAKQRVQLKQFGYLFAATHVGLLIVATIDDDGSKGPTYVYGVTRFATNRAGDVVLLAGGVAYDGYQTDDLGFLATGELGGSAPSTLSLGAVPTRLPLSRSDGLFSVSTRTWYTAGSGREGGDPTDWTGEAAIAFNSDSITVDLYLENSAGGTTGMYARDRLGPNNTFDLWTDKRKHLKGYVRNGVLEAEWTDPRDTGAFSGKLHGERW
jgi:S1-C subfamily serine protease